MMPAETGSSPDQKLSQNVEISTLCAFYGGLLTERQRTALQLHYDEDWSLAEVADHLGVSRQNVHDLITRSAQKLRHCEQAVGGVAQTRRIGDGLRKVIAALETNQSPAAIRQITQIIADIDGEE